MKNYWSCGIDEVEGWLSQGIAEPLTEVDRFQREAGILGSVMEIGVHQGKFFIPLALLKRPEEYALGIDLFEDQGKNIDGSGKGDFGAVSANLEKHVQERSRVELLRRDSLSLTPLDKVEFLKKYGPFRIVSIDGGHTPFHTVNDLLFVQDILQSGGIVILDDYYNLHWPGVHEGVARFFLQNTPKIRIFCYTQNKLFLTDLSHYRRYFTLFQKLFSSKENFKKVRMWDSEAVVY